MNYDYKRQVLLPYEAAVQKAKDELKKEGFGVLTEIDVKATLKNKLNVDYGKYTILGACNPPFAYEALKAEKDIGLLMPCNVIVYEQDGKTFIAGVRPSLTMTLVVNPKLDNLGPEVERKLHKAIDSV